MEFEKEFQYCRNCRKDVASANFSLHEAHCLRFLVVCPICDQPIQRKAEKEHQAIAHQQVRCQLCQQSMQQYLLEEHKDKCSKRRVQCKFCKLPMPFSCLQEHEVQCGARTELCFDCHKYVLVRDQSRHKDVCLNVKHQAPKKQVRCPKCKQEIPKSQFFQHQNQCDPLSEFTKLLSPHRFERSKNPLPRPNSSFPDQAAGGWAKKHPKEERGKEFPSASKPMARKWYPGRKAQGDLALASAGRSWGPPAPRDESEFDVLDSCPQCRILLPKPTLHLHQKKCLFLASLKNRKLN
ncbi:XIAP-associated factor 1 [Ornithorhynchus anatinus]|uniref:XIAP-associated factor 1 n=1 Tax=Ornithorhynchus anatinus TaxID=9258 RepID=UPI0010A91CEA|nr:XIAP-associated factor 1 [Ornithorhynchus anatinus]